MQTLLKGLRAARQYAAGDWLCTFAVVFVALRVADSVGVF